ncbi:MAG: molybdenum cofactor guanylyltransferase [Streptosporangiaceae bacterium]
MPTWAAIVLAGGRSSRMGTPKAWLEWHGCTLLHRTVGLVSRVAGGPVVVVRAPGQPLPPLPRQAEVTDDPREGLGPVQGIAAGLAAVSGRAERAFVCATDLPFLHPAFVRRVLTVAPGADVTLPVARGFAQPLAAAYRTALAPAAAELVAQRRLRPAFLFERCTVMRLDEAALRADPAVAALDPDLESLCNVNEPGEYARARARPAPLVTVRWTSPDGLADVAGLAGPAVRADSGRPVRAATLTAAAAAVGVFGPAGLTDLAVWLNGDPVPGDPELPLAAGDMVMLRPAGTPASPDSATAS